MCKIKRLLYIMIWILFLSGCIKADDSPKAPKSNSIYHTLQENQQETDGILEKVMDQSRKYGFSQEDIFCVIAIEDIRESETKVGIVEVQSYDGIKVVQLIKKTEWEIIDVSNIRNYTHSQVQTMDQQEFSESMIQRLQDKAKLEPWRRDATSVLKRLGGQYGFSRFYDEFIKIGEKTHKDRQVYIYRLRHGDKEYEIELIQPGVQGAEGIWMFQTVKEVQE